MLGITNREYPGIILEELDKKNRGRYKVLIPELMYVLHDSEEEKNDDGFEKGIFCVNHTHKWRDVYVEEVKGSEKYTDPIGGEYNPLQEDTWVIVKFFSEDFESGYIDRVISDFYEDSMPLKLPKEARDVYYQTVRSTNNDLIAISTSEKGIGAIPKKSLHIYHNKKLGQIIMCDEAMNIKTDNGLDILVSAGNNLCLVSRTRDVGIRAAKDIVMYANKIYLNCHPPPTCTECQPIEMDGDGDGDDDPYT
jgi:hypothetical protein